MIIITDNWYYIQLLRIVKPGHGVDAIYNHYPGI